MGTTKIKKKKYKIPVSYEMYGWIEVEATNLKEAIDIAYLPQTGLPYNVQYVDGSFEVDEELAVAEYPEE